MTPFGRAAQAIARFGRRPVSLQDAWSNSLHSATTADSGQCAGRQLRWNARLETWTDGAAAGLSIRHDRWQEEEEVEVAAPAETALFTPRCTCVKLRQIELPEQVDMMANAQVNILAVLVTNGLPLVAMSGIGLHVFTTATAYQLAHPRMGRYLLNAATFEYPLIAEAVAAYYVWQASGSDQCLFVLAACVDPSPVDCCWPRRHSQTAPKEL